MLEVIFTRLSLESLVMVVAFPTEDLFAPACQAHPLSLGGGDLLLAEASTEKVLFHFLLLSSLFVFLPFEYSFAVVVNVPLSAPYLYSVVKLDALNLPIEGLSITNVLPEFLIDRVISSIVNVIIRVEKHVSDFLLMGVQTGRVSLVLAYSHHTSDALGHFILDLGLSLLDAHVLGALLAESRRNRGCVKVLLYVLERLWVH